MQNHHKESNGRHKEVQPRDHGRRHQYINEPVESQKGKTD